KAINARNAGAIGVIIYNNTGGSAAYTPGGVDTAVTFPVFGMSQTDGEALLTLLNANNNSINSNITAPKTYYTLTNGSADLSSPIAINTGKITKDTTISISVYAQSGQVTGANNIGYYVTNNCGNTQSILIKVAQPSSSVSNRSICNGDSLLFNGTYYKTAGTYTSKLTNSVGCDSSLVLNLTVLAPLKTSINHKICETALPFSINGLTFNEAGSQTQKLTSSNGCDSFVTHILSTVSDGIFDFATITQPKCDSVFGSINVNHYTISRKYKSSIDSLDKTQIGLLDINNLQSTACGDPIVVPSLVINDSRTRFYESYKFRNTSNQAKCFGFGLTNYNALHPLRVVAYLDSFVASNPSTNYLGNMQKISGSGNQYANVTVPAGRDIEFVVSNLNNGASYGDYIFEVSGFEPMEYSIDSGATWQTSKNFKVSQGKYNIAMRTGDTYCTQFYFDNPVLINSKKSTSSTQSIAVCPSALPYTWNSLTFTAAGSQTKTGLTNSQGCDSSATLNLTVKTNTLSTTNLSVCPSALPYSWNGLTFTATGSKTKTGLTNSQGCDSSATLNLIVSAAPVTNALNFSGCQQVVYKGKTYLNSTTFIDTAKNSLGCDSIYYTVYMTVRNTTPVIQTQNLSGCKKLFFNGITYTTNTTLRDTLFSSFNCDSIYKITNITINTNCVYYVNTTFTVSMTNYLRTGNTIDTGGIRIAGNFADLGINLPNWTPTSPLCKLTKLGSTDDWSITIPIPDTSINKKLLFKFVNTNWDKNEGIDFGSELRNSTLCSVSDGGGNYNRFLVLPTNDSSVNYCWERCSLCNTTGNHRYNYCNYSK
ncbi:MAG: hypothetical protein NTZ59_15690, partial [Bacteroidetes bacterium]|nr:hypothetical protein [Bacteroidota bacterium]